MMISNMHLNIVICMRFTATNYYYYMPLNIPWTFWKPTKPIFFLIMCVWSFFFFVEISIIVGIPRRPRKKVWKSAWKIENLPIMFRCCCFRKHVYFSAIFPIFWCPSHFYISPYKRWTPLLFMTHRLKIVLIAYPNREKKPNKKNQILLKDPFNFAKYYCTFDSFWLNV